MSDFSMFSLFTAGLACLVPFASAYTQPTGDAPVGNPIALPGLNDVVPVGQPYTVTWTPTTSGTVTLVLLKGPSNNAVPQYAIVEGIANSGTYSWTPSTDLAPGSTGYGIQLIVDATGQYQYTTQFGISNPSYSSSSSTSASATASATSSDSSDVWGVNSWFSHSGWAHPTSGSWSSDSAWASATATTSAWSSMSSNSSALVNSTTSAPTTTPVPATISATMPANSSIVHPTGSMTVPTSLKTSASASASSAMSASSSAPAATRSSTPTANGASNMASSFVGLVVAAGVAVFAL